MLRGNPWTQTQTLLLWKIEKTMFYLQNEEEKTCILQERK